MRGTCCIRRSVDVDSGNLGYRPVDGGEVVITEFITGCGVSVGDW